MGLAKSREGYYVLPEDLRLQRMVGELVDSIEVVNNFIVLRTPSGIASGVTVALDAAELKGVAGSLAGDDTVFVMCYSSSMQKTSPPSSAGCKINKPEICHALVLRARISQNHSKQKWGRCGPHFHVCGIAASRASLRPCLRHLRHELLVRLVDLFARKRAVGGAIRQRERHRLLAFAHALGVAIHVEQMHALKQFAARALHALHDLLARHGLVHDERGIALNARELSTST